MTRNPAIQIPRSQGMDEQAEAGAWRPPGASSTAMRWKMLVSALAKAAPRART